MMVLLLPAAVAASLGTDRRVAESKRDNDSEQ